MERLVSVQRECGIKKKTWITVDPNFRQILSLVGYSSYELPGSIVRRRMTC